MNWVGELGFGLPSRPVRTQIVSFYCSSDAPTLSSPGVYSKPDSEFSENQQGEKRVECNTLIIFTYYITSPPQGSRPGEKGRDLQGAALQRPCAAHDRLRPLTRLSRAAAGRQVLAQVVLPAPVQPPGERRQHDERTGHHHHREIGADHGQAAQVGDDLVLVLGRPFLMVARLHQQRHQTRYLNDFAENVFSFPVHHFHHGPDDDWLIHLLGRNFLRQPAIALPQAQGALRPFERAARAHQREHQHRAGNEGRARYDVA